MMVSKEKKLGYCILQLFVPTLVESGTAMTYT